MGAPSIIFVSDTDMRNPFGETGRENRNAVEMEAGLEPAKMLVLLFLNPTQTSYASSHVNDQRLPAFAFLRRCGDL